MVEDNANAKVAEVFEATSACFVVGFGLELRPCPEGGHFSGDVEAGGFVESGEVVVAHHGPGAAMHDQVEALAGIGAVTDDIAEANDAFNATRFDVIKDDGERFEIAMDVGNHGGGTRGADLEGDERIVIVLCVRHRG